MPIGSMMMARNSNTNHFTQMECDDDAHLKTTDIDVKAELMWANNHLTANTPTHSLLANNAHHTTANAHHTDNKAHLASIKAEIQYHNNTGASGSLAHSLVAIKTAQTNNTHKTQLTAWSNAAGTGSQYHITADSGGRMYINSDLGIPVNALTDGGANQSLRTNGEGSIRTASQKTTGEWLASGSLADDAYSAALDCSKFKHIRLFGKWTGSTTNMPLMISQTSGGTYYALSQQEWITQVSVDIGGSTEYHIEAVVECCGNFIKVYNQSGGAKTLEIDYVGISN